MYSRHNFIVKTPGRTGSHLILSHFHRLGYSSIHTDSGNTDYDYFENIEENTRCIVHDHSHVIPYDCSKWSLIINTRRDKFRQALSGCLARAQNNYGHTPPNSEFRTTIDPKELEGLIHRIYLSEGFYHMLADKTRDSWISVHTVEHEQFLDNPSALSDEFGGFPMRRTWEGACANPGVDHERATLNYQELANEFTSDRLEWIAQQVQKQVAEEYDRRQAIRRSLRQRGLRRFLSFNYF